MKNTPISRRRALPLLAAGALAPWAPRLGASLLAFDDREYPPKQIDDPVLRERLERFQEWKFGLFMHWGIYAEWGAVESWPMEGVEGYGRTSLPQWEECGHDLREFRRRYRALRGVFDPRDLDVAPWVEAARAAGMRYLMFTTKHHDGFCMFETRHTDFRVTHPSCPFHDDPRADVTGTIFSAFREAGFPVGAYYSKPDWNHPDFWDPSLPAPDKFPNYDVALHPERWARFVQFTHAQIDELMERYRPDILWFDGSWVQPPKYDIEIDAIARQARKRNRELIVVDRWVAGPHENYYTPEQKVPAAPLPHAWESCITMGDQWSFKPGDRYKSVRHLVQLLVEVVAKGGNLLLNIGPGPDGRWDPIAHERLGGVARWMAVNAEAIHGTRALPPYRKGNVALTQKGSERFAIHLAPEGEVAPPKEIVIPDRVAEGSAVELLGGGGGPLVVRSRGAETIVEIPAAVRATPPCEHAWAVRYRA